MMFKVRVLSTLIGVICLLPQLSIAQQGLVISDAVLMRIDGQPITAKEFSAIYEKNNKQAKAIDPKTVDEYLEMFINFKLKVREAEIRGMDTAQSFINELSRYRRQLAKPYLTDPYQQEEMVTEAYERMQQDVAAMHILLKLDENAPPSDTLATYKQIKALRSEIESKEDFKKAVKDYSHDQYNEGDLGYFTVFQMVYPFETAAYETPVGEVSQPVRTKFGYHLVYVYDKRPAQGRVRVSHILASSKSPEGELTDEPGGKEKIDMIYEKLENGASFEAMVSQYSDDVATKDKGGMLPWFGVGPGGVNESFANRAFALEDVGNYSEPFETEYGWHIVKLIDREPIPTIDEATNRIEQRIARDNSRLSKSRDALLKNLKQGYSYKMYPDALAEMEKYITDEYYKGKWSADKFKGENKKLFEMKAPFVDDKLVVTQREFAQYMADNRTFQRNPKVAPEVVVSKLFDYFEEDQIIKYEDQLLEEKYPEFRALVREYHDGILLFDLMEEKVWSAAVKDTAGLEAFYKANKAKYIWPDRLDASLFYTQDQSMAKKVYKFAKKRGKKGTLTNAAVLQEFNSDTSLNVRAESDIYKKGDREVIDQIDWKVKTHKPVNIDGTYYIAHVNKVLLSSQKKLSEARGLVIADYQKQLEEKWIEELRAKYEVTVAEPALKGVRAKYK